MGVKAWLLVDDRTYLSVYQAYKKEYGIDETETVWKKAGEKYEDMLISYEEQEGLFRREISGQLLKGIAIYKTIKRKHPDKALKMMEDGLKAYAKTKHKKLRKRLKTETARRIFVFLYFLNWKYRLSHERGYVHDEVVSDKMYRKMKVLVHECPYQKCCMDQEVPELLPLFCEFDMNCYKNIPRLITHLDQVKEEDGIKSCEIYMGLYQDHTAEEKQKKKKEERKKKWDKWKKRFFFI